MGLPLLEAVRPLQEAVRPLLAQLAVGLPLLEAGLAHLLETLQERTQPPLRRDPNRSTYTCMLDNQYFQDPIRDARKTC